jgi:hypothetical protein
MLATSEAHRASVANVAAQTWGGPRPRPEERAVRVTGVAAPIAARPTGVTSSEAFPSGPFLRYWRADAVSGLGT